MRKKTFAEIKTIVEKEVKIAMGKEAEDLSITFAKQEKEPFTGRHIWKVNVEYKKKKKIVAKSALFRIDAITGEVIEFKEDYTWKY